MATAVDLDRTTDDTNVPLITRGAITLAVIQTLCVVAVSFANRLDGASNRILTAVVVAIGAAVTIFYPGIKTRARTIEGIAGAAGIGLGATWIFVFVDAFALQPMNMYTNRWRAIGGGSIWWYLPVWWMVGTYLSWMGGWILANMARRTGAPSLPGALAVVAVLTAICGAGAAMVGFPGAGWNVPTFAIAVLPALALGTLFTGLSASRS